MRIVIALGGNALLRRGQPLTAEVQRRNVRIAAEAIAPVANGNELVISHGNGPQVGLLALQGAAYEPDAAFPLDVLGAETEGMIGYVIEQELGNLLPSELPIATLLTMVEVDPRDPAFRNPTKFVGPVYEKAEADRIARQTGWAFAEDGAKWRRVVPSPEPKRIFEILPIQWLLERGTLVICAGGGGIPTLYAPGAERTLVGVEAVVDKDACSPFSPRTIAGISARAPIAALRPVARAKRQAASTFGPIEPAARGREQRRGDVPPPSGAYPMKNAFSLLPSRSRK